MQPIAVAAKQQYASLSAGAEPESGSLLNLGWIRGDSPEPKGIAWASVRGVCRPRRALLLALRARLRSPLTQS
jgi:hypothetical protein